MRCVVLGAGLAGLVCALELVRRDCHVTLVEAAPFAGGRSSSWQTSSGMPVGAGLHVVATHYVNLLDVLESLGVLHQITWWDEHYYLTPNAPPAIWRFNHLPVPFHLVYTARRMPLPLAERFRLLRASLDVARYRQEDLIELDGLPYVEWQERHRLRDAFLYELADLVSDAAAFLPMDKVSARPVLSWLKYMSRNAAAGRIGTWRVPLAEGLVNPLLTAITSLGGEVRTGTAAVRLNWDATRIRGVVVSASSASGPCYRADGDAGAAGPEEEIPCDFVVSALPVQALRRLLDAPIAAHARLEGALKLLTVPAISVVIGFDRPIRPIPKGAPLVTGCAIRDFIDLSTLGNGTEKNSVIQFLVRESNEWVARSDEEIAQAMLEGLEAVWPQARGALPIETHVERIGAAMAAAVPWSYRLRPPAETGIRNFFLAGDWTRHNLNSSMEGAALSGRIAAKAVLRTQGVDSVRVLTSKDPFVHRILQIVAGPRTRSADKAA